ncbi:MAG: adenylate/guanylate cyclase domain-containing protein, partial [Myxococcales bacterium]
MGSDRSVVLRQNLARHNEDLVMAENALQGERIVSWIRLATIGLNFVSHAAASLISGQTPIRDPIRGTAIACYAVFTVAMILVLRSARPSPRHAMAGPVAATLVDFAFFSFMGMRFWDVERQANPQMGAAILGLILCWSVARYSWIHVALSTA